MKIYLTTGSYGLDAVGGRLPGRGEFDYDDYNAIALVYNGNLYIGDDMSNEAGYVYHSMVIKMNRIPQGKGNLSDGRVWYDKKIMTFYTRESGYRFPSSAELADIITKLKTQLAEKLQAEGGEYSPERLKNEQYKLDAIQGIEGFTFIKTISRTNEYFKNGRPKVVIVMMTVNEYIKGGYNGDENHSEFMNRCSRNNIIDLVDGNYAPSGVSTPKKINDIPGDSEYEKLNAYRTWQGYPNAVEEALKRKKIILTEEQAKWVLKEISSMEIDTRAQEANTNPTEAQKEAGNYKMGHISVRGMQISIENPKGSYRKYKQENGDVGYNLMHNHYGYFNITKGKDGDAVDVFIGPNIDDFTNVYCVDQNNKEGEFDETKVMLGFLSKEEAKAAYLSNYSPTWRGFRDITGVTLKTFKKWLYRGRKQRQPFADYVEIQKKSLEEEVKVGNVEQNQKFLAKVQEVENFIKTLEGYGGKTVFTGRWHAKREKRDYTFDYLVLECGGGKKGEQSSFVVKAVQRAIKNLREQGFKLESYHGV